jgi:hypothetical protein
MIYQAYFYKCEKCFSQTKIETDDEQFANKRIAHFKKYHNCKGKDECQNQKHQRDTKFFANVLTAR